LPGKPKILCVGDPSDHATFAAITDDRYEVVKASNALDVLASLSNERFHCVYFFAADDENLQLARLIQSDQILKGMPDGAALIDETNAIVWANDRLKQWCGKSNIQGVNFYAAFDQPDILGPDFCPFHTAITMGEESVSTLRAKDDQYFHVHAAPVIRENDKPCHLIVTVRDVTTEVLQQQKMAAIHQAGIELSNLSAEEVFEMAIEDRIELLKSNILHFTKDLLKFDVVEIRLLDQRTGELVTLLSEGIDSENADRKLFARPMDNGVTGFVAATGNSYLCEDTTEDPLYLEGHVGAKSSLTVPLIQHDQVIGTFNVESPQPRAFTENDLQFLEIFSRDVAVALNTLELLVAQQANTAQASVEAIHGKVALPVDEILNDAVNVMERYIGHEPTVVKRLQRILRNARDIKQVIQRVGEEMTPAEAVTKPQEQIAWPRLQGRHVLVVDDDESVRGAAHSLLEKYGCVVETAHEGEEAVLMVRNIGTDSAYDVIIADIRLPDMSGYELLLKLQQTLTFVPLVLMSGFGYDPGHSIVKARQAGLLPNAILYKPFRLDQLLATVDGIIENADKVAPS
jgi:CheY-like chemotaxis protein/GAF domain-containing protein